MTSREALEALARNEKLDQPTIRRLLEAGLITASDVTNMGTPSGQREYLPIAMTLKGQRLLDNRRDERQKKRQRKSWYKELRRRIPALKLKRPSVSSSLCWDSPSLTNIPERMI